MHKLHQKILNTIYNLQMHLPHRTSHLDLHLEEDLHAWTGFWDHNGQNQHQDLTDILQCPPEYASS